MTDGLRHRAHASRVGSLLTLSAFMRRTILTVLCALALAACGTDPGEASADASTDGPLVVEVATADALVDDLATLGADTVVLNVWATWCGPCVAEFPIFVAYAAEHDDVAVRFVSVDTPRDLDAVRTFLAEQQVADPSYLYTGPGDLPSQLSPLFGGGAIPVTMILDGDGGVQYTHVGAINRDELDRLVATAGEPQS